MNITQIFILNFLIANLFLLSCASAEKTEGKADSGVPKVNAVNNSNIAYNPTYEQNEKPQYIISAKQGDVVLGDIIVELMPEVAPKHVRNFDSLVSIGFYDGCAFHRVIPGFMIQGGDPNTKTKPRNMWGQGDPSQTTVPAEFSSISHDRGILSTARKGNDVNSATSQFFICVENVPHLDGQYTVFGKVLSGMDVADKIVNVPRDGKDNPNEKIEMMIKRLK